MRLSKYKIPFDNIPPLGYILRDIFKENWLRVHNLNNAKRYSDNLQESTEIIFRNKMAFDESIKNNAIGFLTTFDLDLNELDNQWIKLLNLQYFNQYDISEDEEPYFVTTYSFIFDELYENMILDIANDEFDGKILFYSLSNGNIFAPYDGGIDLFIFNKNKYSLFKNNFKDYLPKKESGL